MNLYKYLSPKDAVRVLSSRRVRFTQPVAFNDPFEFLPAVSALAPATVVSETFHELFEKTFSEQVAARRAKLPVPVQERFDELMAAQRQSLKDTAGVEIHRMWATMEPGIVKTLLQQMHSSMNDSIGVLCLSEVRDSLLMWGHYTVCHTGIVVGFNANHPFFSARRGPADELGYLRQVIYRDTRPNLVLTDSDARDFFQTKSSVWAYEKEWRIMRYLPEATQRIDIAPYPVCLFEFPCDTVTEIIIGLRAENALVTDVCRLAAEFPRAALLKAGMHATEYRLVLEPLR